MSRPSLQLMNRTWGLTRIGGELYLDRHEGTVSPSTTSNISLWLGCGLCRNFNAIVEGKRQKTVTKRSIIPAARCF